MAEPRRLLTDWQVARTEPGEFAGPGGLTEDLDWVPMSVPGTALAALRDAGRWDDECGLDPDAYDWWFRTTIVSEEPGHALLRVGGLATIADMWVDGTFVLHSENMFVAHEVPVLLTAMSEVVIVCRSLAAHLRRRRQRGRWKTRLVEAQQLRWVRTTLLGRMPGWNPAIAPVGPWRPVEIIVPTEARFERRRVQTSLDGDDGVVEVEGLLHDAEEVERVEMRLSGADLQGVTVSVACLDTAEGRRVTATARLPHPPLWFPATHGPSPLVDVTLVVHLARRTVDVPVGRVGFRTVAADTSGGGFSVLWNGLPVFCRGACWVPPDPVALVSTRAALRVALDHVVAAGLNMIRVTGTLAYEQEELYDLCDELGIMVFHDLMFANLDYPDDDAAFVESVEVELHQFAQRMQGRPCLAVLCGGSEVDQQAAMMGLDAASQANPWGHERAPVIVAAELPGVPYVANSPTGGPLPFTVRTGISHYYGVGAYLRPLEDARRSAVRFAAECLAFANVPERATVELLLRDGERPGHSPRWKQRVPRDRGAGWDFEDVRDHYVRTNFGVDPLAVRWTDPDRYLDIGRAAVHVAIDATISEFRRPDSGCAGALVLMLRDVWPGAGWGLIDATGRPKSAYHALADACAPLALLVTDEGLDGLHAHVVNDGPDPLTARLRVSLYGASGTRVESAEGPIEIGPHAGSTISIDAMFPGFRDLAYAYRFGPPAHDVVHIALLAPSGEVIAERIALPAGHARPVVPNIGLAAAAVRASDDVVELVIRTEQFAHFVSIDLDGWVPEHNWFHLRPGGERRVRCSAEAPTAAVSGVVRALNSLAVAGVRS